MDIIIFDYNRTLYNPDISYLFPETIDLLESLVKKYTLFLFGKGDENRRKQVKDLDLEKYFKEIIIKPDKSKSDLLKWKEKYPDSNFCVVGDRINSEIVAGIACNFYTIWYRNGKFANEMPQDPSEEPDYIIESLNEVPNSVEKVFK